MRGRSEFTVQWVTSVTVRSSYEWVHISSYIVYTYSIVSADRRADILLLLLFSQELIAKTKPVATGQAPNHSGVEE